ncbi:MAG: NADP-specific glutamate dehydrogenase [Solobacterium sp.]|nr:NADP-specific glutamate dehydrogenase [Solobacterium sp.]
MGEYIKQVLDDLRQRNPHENEFLEAVAEVFSALDPVIDSDPKYRRNAVLERMSEPDRTISFRVVWQDDEGKPHVNRGWRVQFNGAIGPYKGGLRFSEHVSLGTLKFLGFEQTFKNALTGLPMGGGKGGSDFNPIGKSDSEIMRFCQAFMTELYRHIGPDTDVPAGDIGVSAKEIGYLYGQYRRLTGAFQNGVLTGKDLSFGGSLLRPEATGYGAVAYLQEVLKHENDTLAGKRIAVSGYGNAAWGVIKKAASLGAVPVTLSGRDGYIYDLDGITTEEKINSLLEIRADRNRSVRMYAERFHVPWFPDERPWGRVKADIWMPCATQNEVSAEDAQRIVDAGGRYYLEVANMPAEPDALHILQKNGLICAPGKAVNAGGVAVSGLEMSQNALRLSWTAEEVETRLNTIMHNIYRDSVDAAERYGFGYDLIKGANIAGFLKVAEAMIKQGLI